jgi:hypothetical protein
MPTAVILTIKAALSEIEPAIYRTIRIDSDASFDDLHILLQLTFGFEDEHLFQFSPTGMGSEPCFGVAEDPEEAGAVIDLPGAAPLLDATEYAIENLLRKQDDKAVYVYDMGDQWNFDLEVIAVEEGELELPEVVAGEGPNLIEDVGGPEGLVEVLQLVQQRDAKGLADFFMAENGDEILAELEEWLPFDAESANQFVKDFYEQMEQAILENLNGQAE